MSGLSYKNSARIQNNCMEHRATARSSRRCASTAGRRPSGSLVLRPWTGRHARPSMGLRPRAARGSPGDPAQAQGTQEVRPRARAASLCPHLVLPPAKPSPRAVLPVAPRTGTNFLGALRLIGSGLRPHDRHGAWGRLARHSADRWRVGIGGWTPPPLRAVSFASGRGSPGPGGCRLLASSGLTPLFPPPTAAAPSTRLWRRQRASTAAARQRQAALLA
jgi:hypothetical protein